MFSQIKTVTVCEAVYLMGGCMLNYIIVFLLCFISFYKVLILSFENACKLLT